MIRYGKSRISSRPHLPPREAYQQLTPRDTALSVSDHPPWPKQRCPHLHLNQRARPHPPCPDRHHPCLRPDQRLRLDQHLRPDQRQEKSTQMRLKERSPQPITPSFAPSAWIRRQKCSKAADT